jgi:hypothetical protein
VRSGRGIHVVHQLPNSAAGDIEDVHTQPPLPRGGEAERRFGADRVRSESGGERGEGRTRLRLRLLQCLRRRGGLDWRIETLSTWKVSPTTTG